MNCDLPGLGERASFVARLNRFVAIVRFKGRETPVYVPNTGRLGELLLPGSEVALVPQQGKYAWRLQHVFYRGRPVFVDSTMANSLFAAFMDRRAVSGLEDHTIVRREPSLGRHRFDFEVADGRGELRLLEVKSCSLAWNDVASFPDAVSSRALEHVRLLSHTPRGLLVFLLMHERIKTFVPNYHTDFAFYQELKKAAPLLDIRACCLVLDEAMRPEGVSPVAVTIPHVDPCGAYIMVFHDSSTHGARLSADARDFFIVAGVDQDNVFAAMARMKKIFCRARHGGAGMKVLADYPLLGPAPSMDEMGALLEKMGGSDVSLRFDECAGAARVFHCREHPGNSGEFWDSVLRWRFGGFSRS